MKNSNIPEDPLSLMMRAKEGDGEAFGRLYELYFVPVSRYISLRVKQKEDARDLTQEVFMRVYQAAHGFSNEQKPPLAYFFTVARNAVIDYWRKDRTVLFENPTVLEAVADEREGIQGAMEKKEIGDALRNAIGHLTEDQQEVIVLKFINEVPNRDIAALLGKSEEAIRQLQCRALKALRHDLKKNNFL